MSVNSTRTSIPANYASQNGMGMMPGTNGAQSPLFGLSGGNSSGEQYYAQTILPVMNQAEQVYKQALNIGKPKTVSTPQAATAPVAAPAPMPAAAMPASAINWGSSLANVGMIGAAGAGVGYWIDKKNPVTTGNRFTKIAEGTHWEKFKGMRALPKGGLIGAALGIAASIFGF